jgi:hypothetical protein
MDLADLLHAEIFVADGGVDDHETWTPAEKRKWVSGWLVEMSTDETFLEMVAHCDEGRDLS